MENFVCTAFGDSEPRYAVDKWSITLKPPTQGSGQRNGAAPDIWEIVSTPIINFLRDAGKVDALK